VNVRWRMIIVPHSHNDAEEDRKNRHVKPIWMLGVEQRLRPL
jgi:hypothetical protein